MPVADLWRAYGENARAHWLQEACSPMDKSSHIDRSVKINRRRPEDALLGMAFYRPMECDTRESPLTLVTSETYSNYVTGAFT